MKEMRVVDVEGGWTSGCTRDWYLKLDDDGETGN